MALQWKHTYHSKTMGIFKEVEEDRFFLKAKREKFKSGVPAYTPRTYETETRE